LWARTPEKRMRRPQIHRVAVLHCRSILRPPDYLKWDPRCAYTTYPPFPDQARPSPSRIRFSDLGCPGWTL
jgi:hypothetical protein